MRFLNAIGNAARISFKAMTGPFRGQWDGYGSSRLRDRPPRLLIGQDSTVNWGTREAMISEARSLCQTGPVPTRILRTYANSVVGSCRVQWLTTDHAWNKLVETRHQQWSKNCHFRQTHSLQKLAKLAVMSFIRDGDWFVRKMIVDDQPVLEEIEADRVGNYLGGAPFNTDEDKIIGGVKLDAFNRPIGYRVWDRTKFGFFVNSRDVSKSEMLHLFDPLRCDAYRGVTHFAPVLDQFRDMKETVDAERLAQKVRSKISLIIRNALGRPVGQIPGMLNAPATNTDKHGVDIPTQPVGDAAIAYQLPGEDMNVIPNTPGDGWFKLSDFLLRACAVGLDLPLELIWQMLGTGPAVRMVTKQAERTFRNTRDVVEPGFLDPATAWWVNFEMQIGRIPFNPEWYLYKIQPTASISIDAGRDSAANLNELASGVKTEESIAEEQGDDAGEIRARRKMEVREKIRDARDIMDENKDLGVSLETVMSLLGRPNISVAVAEAKAVALDSAAQPDN